MKLVLRVVAVILVLLVAAGLVFYFNPLWVADQNLRSVFCVRACGASM
jgi:hypothetical protein